MADEITGAEAQTTKLASFLLAREGFSPLPEEGAGDSAIRVIGTLEAELAEAKASLRAVRGHATRARNEAHALRLEKSPERRKCGPLRAPKSDEEAAERAQRIAAAIGEDFVDVVASDGKKELIEIAPVRVDGDAWRRRPDGWLLTLPIEHEPGEMDKPEVRIAGYGLFAPSTRSGQGSEQIGWRVLPEPITVRANSRVRVENSIVF
jgi:hypothetical protein